ncbi:glycosyltransferase family 4 protein, partial [Desulfobulbus sp. US1]|nr:glycosyltransferase family 4 protein [Desulfobulbus sp. US1]
QDKFPADNGSSTNKTGEKFALFVGGAFYANRVGITWFVKNVVPHISIKTCIAGRGFEVYKSELEVNGKVKVIGEVDSLAQWYKNSHFVIAPIFDGSGMKTKVAEALMYGKKVVGTPEAFSGYEDIIEKAGWVCRTANDFVASIAEAEKVIKHSFDLDLREIYKDEYSLDAARQRMREVLEDSN